MTWSYCYPAPTATHEPTGLVFSVTYDLEKPEWTIRLDSAQPRSLEQARIETLRDELDQLVRAGRTQRRMSELLHGAYNGDYSHAAAILSSQTKKKVSVRTLQAWMMPPGRPSSRRCPEWALLALEQYLSEHPEASRDWKEVSSIYRSTPDGQTLALHTELRDQRSLRLAEAEIAHDEAIRKKWRGAGVTELLEHLSDLELHLRRVTGHHTDLIGQIVGLTYSCTTFEEFREQLREATRRKANLDWVIRENVVDISRGQKEFSSADGTLPD